MSKANSGDTLGVATFFAARCFRGLEGIDTEREGGLRNGRETDVLCVLNVLPLLEQL